jgi:hypothetical protein
MPSSLPQRSALPLQESRRRPVRAGARSCLLLLSLLLPGAAAADRGALSVDIGGGVSAASISGPYITEPVPLLSTAGSGWLGARYALSHSLELSASAFYEPPVLLTHRGVTVIHEEVAYPGALEHLLERQGLMAGGRVVLGMVWKLVAGLEVGWSRRSFSRLNHIDTRGPGPSYPSHGLSLDSVTVDNLLLSPHLGVEWAAGDKWSISLLPRAHILLGTEPTLAFTLPLVLSYSWYL